MSAWVSLLVSFSHDYTDSCAIVFTLGRHDRPPPEFEQFCRSVAADPVAQAPFVSPVRKRPSPKRLAFYEARRKDYLTETEFWTHELRYANGRKFLHILEAEKAKSDAPPGTHKTTWIFVHFKGDTLNLGVYDWVVGNKKPYTKFTKAKSRRSFYR